MNFTPKPIDPTDRLRRQWMTEREFEEAVEREVEEWELMYPEEYHGLREEARRHD